MGGGGDGRCGGSNLVGSGWWLLWVRDGRWGLMACGKVGGERARNGLFGHRGGINHGWAVVVWQWVVQRRVIRLYGLQSREDLFVVSVLGFLHSVLRFLHLAHGVDDGGECQLLKLLLILLKLSLGSVHVGDGGHEMFCCERGWVCGEL